MAYNKEDNSELRALQLTTLEIMKIFVDICERHGLRYYMTGGTMLCAVRHKGFIPWDDDMDVGMPRPDYEKLQEIVREELPEGYGFLTYRQDTDYKRCFNRIVDKQMVVTNMSYAKKLDEYVWLDIFPFDGLPGSWLGRWVHFWHITFLRFLYYASTFDQMVNLNRPHRKLYLKLIIRFLAATHFGSWLNTRKIMDRMERGLMKYPYDGSKYVVSLYGAYMTKEVMPLAIMDNCADYPFEDSVFKGPKRYDEYLTRLYGDYMTPPQDKDKNKHNLEKIKSEKQG